MQPIHIMVLLHHGMNRNPFPGIDYTINLPYSSKILGDAYVLLVNEDLMRPKDFGSVTVDNFHGTTYTITEKGRVMINALMSVPLPVQAWTMPKPGRPARS